MAPRPFFPSRRLIPSMRLGLRIPRDTRRQPCRSPDPRARYRAAPLRTIVASDSKTPRLMANEGPGRGEAVAGSGDGRTCASGRKLNSEGTAELSGITRCCPGDPRTSRSAGR
ncbi:hypothetical protein SVIO_002930 [Streptomyces violaceusniger]|uniref:Uncharacterized protein n=1 Tax=Streptomyces violaceusniger TaxID=68280 RepID=A0A4D4KSX2_STRVO|nr:hypothetical protein SVIO_002930 [Streptomyces violaceusniger]